MRAIAARPAPAVVVHEGGPVGTVVVPGDGWQVVRRVLVIVYAAVFVYWVREWGLIVDRISILLAVVVLLVVANAGRPWYRWRQLVGDVVLYGLLFLAYGETRGAAQRFGAPLQVESVRNIDRGLFLGADPTVWLQRRFYDPTFVHWYDVTASIVYSTHFVVPFAVIAILWVIDRRRWVRFMRRWSTVLFVSCVSFVLLPTAPPWMAAGGDLNIRLDALPPLARPAGRGWSHLGLERFSHAWEIGQDWVNKVAAMPSLHAAYALLVVAFFLPRVRRPSARAALLCYPLAMGLALVYLAEHYVADVLAGWAVVGLSFVVWNGIERLIRRRRIERCRHALSLRAGCDAAGDVGVIGQRRVFLDATFLDALLDPDDPAHDETRDAFEALLTEYLRGETLLYALEQPLPGIGDDRRKEVTAVCDVIKVRRWLRRAADRVIASNPRLALRFDEAAALVVIDRFRLREVASASRNSQHFRN